MIFSSLLIKITKTDLHNFLEGEDIFRVRWYDSVVLSGPKRFVFEMLCLFKIERSCISDNFFMFMLISVLLMPDLFNFCVCLFIVWWNRKALRSFLGLILQSLFFSSQGTPYSVSIIFQVTPFVKMNERLFITSLSCFSVTDCFMPDPFMIFTFWLG